MESHVRALRKGVLHRSIKKVWIGWPKTIAKPSSRQFSKIIVGRRIQKIKRRGKYILMELSGDYTLVSHFRMTGHWRLAALRDSTSKSKWYLLPTDRFTRVAFMLNKNEILHFSDIRKFGRLWLLPTAQVTHLPEIQALGPEPLSKSFSFQLFRDCLKKYHGMIKPVLLNQRCVAGIGNIYADEALFDAGIHPKTVIAKLKDTETKKIYHAVIKNLKAGVKHRGSSVGEFVNLNGQPGKHGQYLRVYGKKGKVCQKRRAGQKCSGRVGRIVVAGRGTHICPACQKLKH